MSEDTLTAAGWVLVDASVCLVPFALGAAAFLALTSPRRARLRYAVTCGALASALLLAAIDALGTLAPVGRGGRLANAARPPSAAVEVVQEAWKGWWIGTTHRTPPVAATWSEDLIARIDPFMPWAAGAWLVGAAVVIAWHVGGARRVRRLLRRSRPAGKALHATLDQLARRLGLGRSIRLLESSETTVPMVAGFRPPTVIVPARVFGAIDGRSIESLLAHELAHVRRRDVQANWAQTLVETALFFHPAVWWLSRAIRQEREHCCDDLAVRLLEDELVYARSLLRLQEARSLWPQGALAATGAAFAARIERLCSRPEAAGAVPLRRAVPACVAGVAAAAMLAGLAGRQRPLALTADGRAAATALETGLLAHYPFDGDARDSSGQGNDGVVEGAIPTTDRHGKAGAAYDFDGVRARIVAPVAQALESAGSVSVSCWVWPRSHGQWESWVAKSDLEGKHSQWRVGLGVASDEWGLTEYTTTDKGQAWENYWLSRSAVPLGVWSHVVMVLDTPRREVTLYRNGTRLASFSAIELPTASHGKLFVGYQADDRVYFDGKVDDLRVYARALTYSEVRALYRRRS